MRVFFIHLFILVYTLETEAQTVGNLPGKGLDMQTYSGGFVTQLPMAPPETKGDVYLESQWSLAEITLYEKEKLVGYTVRLNLETDAFEINYNSQTKILPGLKVKEFTWINPNTSSQESFVNGKELNVNGVPLEGFFKIIQSGEWSLLSKTNLVLLKGNYVPALDAGERDNKLVKKDDFYLLKESRLLKANVSKKKFIAQFEEPQQKELSAYLSKERLSTTKVEDLLSILKYLNGN